MLNRLNLLMDRPTDNTVLADLLAPVAKALGRVRQAGVGGPLSRADFIALGVLRHLEGMPSLRQQVQALLDLDPDTAARVPLARSSWSDALASPRRAAAFRGLVGALAEEAREVLPDRLAGIAGLGDRSVRAIDGTYQQESAHFRRRTPKQGGGDNPKGHGLLSFYNLRLGVPQ